MKLTNGECFVIENGLRVAADELRKSTSKSLILNTIVARNLKIISELCQSFRESIRDITPDELKELNEKNVEELTEEESTKKEELTKELNVEINKFLETQTEVEFFKINFPLESLANIELGYDASNILQLILIGE